MANYQANFPDKTIKNERINFANRDKVITEEEDVVKKFKDDFEKIWETLKIDCHILSDLSDDPVLIATDIFFHYASVCKIKEARNPSDYFSFKLVTEKIFVRKY